MSDRTSLTRRKFLQLSCALSGGLALADLGLLPRNAFALEATPKVSAHLWVYASAHPPEWDATPDLERAFSDLQHSGFDGVELMAVNLKHDDAVERIGALARKYNLPVTGTSYGAAMWDEKRHDATLKEIEVIVARLSQLKGTTLGLSVGDAKREKTDAELDTQAATLKQIAAVCAAHQVQPNLHNHTYEVVNGMHDLKGTLARLPDYKLGPDLNWLIRGGVDPVSFIQTYGSQMVYMHIRDQYADGQWTEYVGEGVTDFPAIAKALKEKHFAGRAAVELAFPANFTPTQPLSKTWKMSREYVRTTFGW